MELQMEVSHGTLCPICNLTIHGLHTKQGMGFWNCPILTLPPCALAGHALSNGRLHQS